MADRTPSKAKASKSKKSSSSSKAKPNYSNPTFQLPSDFEKHPNRYELWTVRLPIEIPLSDLDGMHVPLNQDGGDEQVFESGEKRYAVSWGSQLENESCRLLVPPSKNAKPTNGDDFDDSSSEEEVEKQKEGFLYPASRPFSRHLNINEHFASMGERTLAPPPQQAPPPTDFLRRAYVPVPQRTNLRRRWQMPGARVVETKRSSDSGVPTKPPAKRKLSEVDTLKASPAPLQEEQKPAAKRKLSETSIQEETKDTADTESARKAAKKAKKEAKRAKKEAKEAKKYKKAEKKLKEEPK